MNQSGCQLVESGYTDLQERVVRRTTCGSRCRPHSESKSHLPSLVPAEANFLSETVNNTYRILNSRLVIFHVGQHADGKASEFHVHLEAIAQLSQPLHDIVNGGFMHVAEAWPNVSKRNFERLAQFAYTGDYTVPKPLRRHAAVNEQEAVENEPLPSKSNHTVEEGDNPPLEDLPAEEVPPAPDAEAPTGDWGSWGTIKQAVPEEPTSAEDPIAAEPADDEGLSRFSFRTGTSKKMSKKKGRRLFAFDAPEPEVVPEAEPELEAEPIDFASLSFPLLALRDNYKDSCEPSEKFNPERNYSNVFLAHAKLWALADIHDIDSLKALTLYKLHKTLCVFEINDDNATEVVQLARFAYTEGCGQSRPDAELKEGLRGLVGQYMAWNSRDLYQNAAFSQLLGEGGLFVQNFFHLVLEKRIWHVLPSAPGRNRIFTS